MIAFRQGKLLLTISLISLLSQLGCDTTKIEQNRSTTTDVATNDISLTGFTRVLGPKPFQFPQDHGPHNDYQTEWWYITGNVETNAQRHFGFQITFFRFALTPEQQTRSSQWATSQIYMAHFALTDVQNNQFYAFERFARDSKLGLAGAQTNPFKVWLGPWELSSQSTGFLPLKLVAADGEIAIELQFNSTKPVARQGTQGFSQKGVQQGNASHYYSLSHLTTEGIVKIGDSTVNVTGSAWLDREWFTSSSTPDVKGWDWFALQLSNQEELMFYIIRNDQQQMTPYSSGTLIDAQGNTQRLSLADVSIEAIDTWTSPLGTTYPQGWHFKLPQHNISLQIQPYQANQEMDHSRRYWEGAVKITGSKNNQPISGSGYVELVGYAD